MIKILTSEAIQRRWPMRKSVCNQSSSRTSSIARQSKSWAAKMVLHTRRLQLLSVRSSTICSGGTQPTRVMRRRLPRFSTTSCTRTLSLRSGTSPGLLNTINGVSSRSTQLRKETPCSNSSLGCTPSIDDADSSSIGLRIWSTSTGRSFLRKWPKAICQRCQVCSGICRFSMISSLFSLSTWTNSSESNGRIQTMRIRLHYYICTSRRTVIWTSWSPCSPQW